MNNKIIELENIISLTDRKIRLLETDTVIYKTTKVLPESLKIVLEVSPTLYLVKVILEDLKATSNKLKVELIDLKLNELLGSEYLQYNYK